MQAIGLFAVAVGLGCLVLLAVVSMGGTRPRRGRGWSDGGPVIPGFYPHDDGGDDDGGGSDGA